MGLWTAIAGLFTAGVNRYGEVREAKHQATLAKIQTAGQVEKIRAQHTATWQQQMAIATRTSWKDQLALVVLLAPFVGVFIPPLAPYILQGFTILGQTPVWYQLMLGAAIMASFGIKWIRGK